MKLLMLLATGQGGQTKLSGFITNMTLKHCRAYFYMSQALKTSRPGTHEQPDSLCIYPVAKRLCSVLYLKEYLNRTKRLRRSGQLFLHVQCVKPYSGVSRDTLIRWTRTVQLSGLDTSLPKPHSTTTREAATSRQTQFSSLPDVHLLAGLRDTTQDQ